MFTRPTCRTLIPVYDFSLDAFRFRLKNKNNHNRSQYFGFFEQVTPLAYASFSPKSRRKSYDIVIMRSAVFETGGDWFFYKPISWPANVSMSVRLYTVAWASFLSVFCYDTASTAPSINTCIRYRHSPMCPSRYCPDAILTQILRLIAGNRVNDSPETSDVARKNVSSVLNNWVLAHTSRQRRTIYYKLL